MRPGPKGFHGPAHRSTGNPAVKDWLRPLLHDADQETVQAAILGLGAIGGDDVAADLAKMLADPLQATAVRIAAVQALGDVATPAARDALISAFSQFPGNDGTAEQILGALGKFPFPTIKATFEGFLSAPGAAAGLRAAAAEALANSTDDAVPYLYSLAQSDADADVRAGAAWAISMHPASDTLGPSLAALAKSETDPDVRRRLYEALLPQQEIPAQALLPTVFAEQDTAARIAGFNAVSAALSADANGPLSGTFDTRIVPELQQLADSSQLSLNLRLRSIFALRRAATPAARLALSQLASSSTPKVSQAASQGFVTINHLESSPHENKTANRIELIVLCLCTCAAARAATRHSPSSSTPPAPEASSGQRAIRSSPDRPARAFRSPSKNSRWSI